MVKQAKASKAATAESNEDFGPDMTYFVCGSCARQYYDLNNYFYGTTSAKCLWCTKFPKAKDAIKTNVPSSN
jgi:hypothetical protein